MRADTCGAAKISGRLNTVLQIYRIFPQPRRLVLVRGCLIKVLYDGDHRPALLSRQCRAFCSYLRF